MVVVVVVVVFVVVVCCVLLLWSLCVVVVVVCCCVVVVVGGVVFMSDLCVCFSTSHAHATESKADYYLLHAKPWDVGQCNLKLLHSYPVTQRRPMAIMMTLMQHMRITN